MMNFTFGIELLSDALVGSGEGWGATIDTDVVFDDIGLPYVPAKRVKGCLRESAVEVAEMFECSKLDYATTEDIDVLFGKAGRSQPSSLSFSNCNISDYDSNKQWLEWVSKEYPGFLSKELVLNTFTSLRQQTAINKHGIAQDNSLRTSRVLKRGLTFFGNIELHNEIDDRLLSFLVLTAINLRHIGTSRNRGFGLIRCTFYDQAEPLNEKYLSLLENKITGV